MRRRSVWKILIASFGFCFMENAVAATKPVLNEWFALGSGCRARTDLPGNVNVIGFPADAGNPDIHRVKFTFTNFKPTSEMSRGLSKKFGRECAIRLNINPPDGKKIVGVKARTGIVASHTPGVTLDLLAELKIGAASPGRYHEQLGSPGAESGQFRPVEIAAGESDETRLPQIGCGEPKIIGFDYSWIASGDSKIKETTLAELGPDKSLIIEAKLADCSP